MPRNIVDQMKSKGYKKFSVHWHTQLWKKIDAKNPEKNFGTDVEGSWYWYENWIKVVEDHCKEYKDDYQ